MRTTLRMAMAILALAGARALAQGGGGGPLIWALTGGDQKAYEDQVQEYDQKHPDAKATLQLFQNDPYKQKLLVAMGAGAANAPDLFFGWGGGILYSYVKAGKVADITSELNADPAWKNRYFPTVMKPVTFEGKVYGVPINGMQPIVIYYNKNVFQDAGVQPPRTWQELLAAVPKLKAKGKALLTLGGANKWTYLMYEEYLVDRLGGPQVFSDIESGKPSSWSNPVVLQANRMIQDLVKAGAFVKGYSGISYDQGQATALLYTGRAAMQVMGTWDYPNILAGQPAFAKGQLGWMAFPALEGGKGDPNAVVGGPANYYSITASSTKKAQAVDFLKNDVLSSANVDLLLRNGSVPPVPGLEAKIAATPQAPWLSFVYDLVKKAPSFQLSWDQALPPAAADALLTNLDRLFLLQITPEQFSDAMNRTLQPPGGQALGSGQAQ